MYVDTHAHLNDPGLFEKTQKTPTQLIKEAKKHGVEIIINIGTTLAVSREVAQIVQKHDNVYGAIAIHPSRLNEVDDKTYEVFQELINNDPNNKIKAIGECGLDYFYDFTNPDLQKEHFVKHLNLARTNNKTVIIHSRSSFNDTYNILKNYQDLRIIIHCYSYGEEEMQKLVNIGCYISFSGIITFDKNVDDLINVVKAIPLDRLLCETDSPLLAPVPHRGKINYPQYVKHIYEKISKIRNEKIEKQVLQNVKKVFNI